MSLDTTVILALATCYGICVDVFGSALLTLYREVSDFQTLDHLSYRSSIGSVLRKVRQKTTHRILRFASSLKGLASASGV